MNDFDNKQICSYKDIDRFGFACDVCGRNVNGCSIVNGMKFCAKCYQETFGKDNQQNEIHQLKQQLTEKDKEIHSLIVDYEKRISQEQELMSNLEKELTELKEKDNYHLRYELAGADETITNLKKQLEEKDKEIEKLKQQYTILENENGKLAKELIVKNYKKAQKEVSFGIQLAIQELEKVNGILTDTIIEITQNEMDLNKLCYLEEISARFYEKMQEQIIELEGQHND